MSVHKIAIIHNSDRYRCFSHLTNKTMETINDTIWKQIRDKKKDEWNRVGYEDECILAQICPRCGKPLARDRISIFRGLFLNQKQTYSCLCGYVGALSNRNYPGD